MGKLFRSLIKDEKGFTLIELLVVIAILGAIAGVVVLNVTGFIGKGVCEGFCTEKHNIVTACVADVASGGTGSGYATYLMTTPKYTWTVTPATCAASASDAPSTTPACACLP